jgi:putative thiamine transport system substrate-binding protein
MTKERARWMVAVLALMLLCGPGPLALGQDGGDWEALEKAARGKTVYFNGWGGGKEINDYVRWAAGEVEKRYGIRLEHVKVADISEVVGRILAEKAAGRTSGGSVDLIWINGENFKAMKEAGLLYGPFVERLPSYGLVNVDDLAVTEDFTVPVGGLEAPWGVGQLTFFYDSRHLSTPPATAAALLAYAKAHPGRVAYPRPPQFHGSSFLKQVLLDLVPDRSPLYRPVAEAAFEEVTAPLWTWLDAFHPVAWRQAGAFPASSAHMQQLLDDGELDIAFTFNPQDVTAGIQRGTLPQSARTFVFDIGALTNCHFLAIPFNSDARDAAMVVINYLLSPEAQGRKADTVVWGDPSRCWTRTKLSAAQKRYFKTKTPLAKGLPEPHPSWMVAIEKAWLEKYSH